MTRNHVFVLVLALSCLLATTPLLAGAGEDIEAPAPDRGFIGLIPQVDDRGATVRKVVEGSPAEAAGLEPGDVLLSIEGEPFPTGSMRAIIDHMGRFRAGDEIEIAFRRDDEVKTARLTLAETPPVTREIQERTRTLEARAEEHAIFGRFLDSVSAFDVTLSESGAILYKKPDETGWTTLGEGPAESFRPVVEQTLAEQGQKIVRLKIERSDGGSMRLVAVPRERKQSRD